MFHDTELRRLVRFQGRDVMNTGIATSPVRKKPNESPATIVRDANIGTITRITPEPTLETLAQEWAREIVTGNDILAISPTRFALRNRLVFGGITALYSAPKTGKSFIAVELALAAALGEKFWNESFNGPQIVLYIAAERASVVRDRIEAACKVRNVPLPKNLHLWKKTRPPQVTNVAHVEALCENIARIRPTLIIFDTYAKMTIASEENATGEASQNAEEFARMVEASGVPCAGLLVHHSGKDPSKGLRGSTALLAAVDAVWKLTGDDVALKLEVEDINAGSKPLHAWYKIESHSLPALEGEVERREVGVLMTTQARDVGTSHSKDITNVFDTTDNLEHSALAMTDALRADGIKIERPTVNKCLANMVKHGEVEKIGKGKNTTYRLTWQTEATSESIVRQA